MRILLSFLIINLIVTADAQINIGILYNKKVQQIFIETKSGKYIVRKGEKRLIRLRKGHSLILGYTPKGINVSNLHKNFGLTAEINITGKKSGYFRRLFVKKENRINEISVKSIKPKMQKRTYADNLSVYKGKGQLKLINHVDFKKYLAGVVEAESGTKAEEEYYKNQAVICRTYAIKNEKKHDKEGFNLCDGVHCQAYIGLATKNELIRKAVRKTGNKVIVDKNNQLINAVFSANCGGQTNNSEDVWSSAISYLKSVTDTFCIHQRQAHWEKKISFIKWKDFLLNNGINLSKDLTIDSFAFEQAFRLKYYTVNNQKIKLTTIRYGLHLRSTFFDVIPDDNQLILKGRGYGHGVGMCQEGAMYMAKKHFKYDEIIKFYYTDVKIKNINRLSIENPFK